MWLLCDADLIFFHFFFFFFLPFHQGACSVTDPQATVSGARANETLSLSSETNKDDELAA